MLKPLKRYFYAAGILLLLAGMIIPAPVAAQDFGQLLDAVDKLEANLKSMIEKETAAREKADAELRGGMGQSEPGGDPAWQNKISDELATLRTKIAGLASGQSNQELASMLNDIEFLKAENLYLRATLEKNAQLYVSVDGEYADPNDETIEQLTRTVLLLNERIENMAAENQTFGYSEPASADLFHSISFSGFVDASNYSDHNAGQSSFGLDQVELDVVKDFSGQASLHADIEYVSDGAGNFDFDLEQGYLSYSVGSGQTWTFSFGKFNAPIGFELLDAPDMFQYSHALVFDNGLPTNLTGIMMSTEFPAVVDWTFYLVNGWDVNTDNNKDKTLGTRVGITPVENLNFGLSFITGPELDGNNSSRRNVFDIDLTWNPLEIWTLGAEYNHGIESKMLDTDDDGSLDGSGNWNGFLLMSNVALGERFGLTTRFDIFNDDDGLRTGTAQSWKAVCVSPSISIVDGLGGLIEFRYDWSDEDFFTGHDGEPKDNMFSSALEFTYGF